METQISFLIDNSILLSLRKSKDEFTKDLLFQYSLYLYRNAKISLGKAAHLAGYDKINFISKLQSENESIYDYEEEEIDEIISQSQKMKI